ncbi:unnamed protein product [Hermetia illucens]|uniref:Shavenoid isoform B-like N-terminal domain-containing protein n=1 Tax=Hermetia illucens TaxID=343691 RepID=A0A7R8YPE4_HERIL|nr:unnamed protein product [Hermetia illucens]
MPALISAPSAAGPTQLIFLWVIFTITWPNWVRVVSASPDPTPHLLADGTLESLETMQIVNLTRQHEGDIFTANELLPACTMDTCVGLSSGTAGLFVPSREIEILPGHEFTNSNSGSNGKMEKCQCRCLQHLNTYREDLGICVDDIHECTLSPFVSGSSSEKIPFVFLPLRGQIIHPSREINFPGVRTPVCAVTSAQYLTQKGWSDLRNPLDTDVPFRLFRDEGRTFLQWLGESDLRHKMQGRLILVHMMCRDMAAPHAAHTGPGHLGLTPKNLFTPCVAFRVNGSPVRYLNNVPEVLFQSENSNLSAPPEGFHTKEYIVIGICSLILGLIYIASVFLYLHVKKRKTQLAEANNAKHGPDSKNPKNDQITYGVPFSRTESFYSGITEARNSQRSNRSQILGGGNGMGNDEMGIVKNNPLLRHFTSLSDNSGFVSDRSNSNSECDDGKKSDRTKNLQTSAIVHPSGDNKSNGKDKSNSPDLSSGNQENECLPEANVSITEEASQDDKLDTMKAIVNGTVRKKLYFNPAYFEPHLLMSPPPAAIEFLTKIREVIAIAKYKMASKRYQPSLNIIPEEHQGSNSDLCAKPMSPQTGTMSVKTENSGRLVCSGCPGCSVNPETPTKCDNCGDKHESIQKWLEGVPFNESSNDLTTGGCNSSDKRIDKIEEVSEKETIDSPQPKKKVPPPLPLTAPKIISHSLKPHVQKSPAVTTEGPIYVKSSSVRGSQSGSPVSPSKRDDDPYSFRKTGGSEIYNNPKFLESPQLSVRSRTSSSKRSRSSKKKVEVLDQYSNPGKDRHYEMLKSIQNMPDMVYEALAKDYSIRNFPASEKTTAQQYNIPTPDYDGTFSKKMKDIYNNSTGSGPFVPTPDYSTMSRRSLRQYQPDSPIYRRRSPQYLIVDYETDSLERGSSLKKGCNSSSPHSNNSSDISSQPSPSLSTALPLEEEVEVHHTVYDKVEGFRKDGDTKKMIASEYEQYSRQRKDSVPKIKYDTPFRGSMTIEVAHDPHSDEVSTDSDQFEPDTLDRKPKKQHSGSFRSLNAWTEYLSKSQSFVNSNDKVSYSSLENMTSLPDFTTKSSSNEQLVLRSSSSFRSSSGQLWDSVKTGKTDDHHLTKQNFGSLREIYQSKVQLQSNRPQSLKMDFNEPGRLLTLDAKHTKRQRKIVSDRLKKLIPPDVIPADNNNFYDIPRSPKKVDTLMRKNLEGWNTSDSSGDMNSKRTNREDTPSPEQTDTISDHSESTEITGVSDTQINSDKMNTSRKPKVSSSQYSGGDRILQIDYSAMYNQQKPEKQPSLSSSNSFISVKIGNDKSYQTYHFNSINSNIYSVPDTIVENNQVMANEDHRDSSSRSTESPIIDRDSSLNIQSVYRVEVPHPSNGMQIAMGLRDRAKKSKDLKNAWKKFVSMATGGKFNGPDSLGKDGPKDCEDPYDHKSVFSEYIDRDRDEGISSLVHENTNTSTIGIKRSRTSGGSLDNLRKTSYQSKFGITRSHSTAQDSYRIFMRQGSSGGHYRQEMDSGYISGDECRPYTEHIYERHSLGVLPSDSSSDGINIINTNPETTSDMQGRQLLARRRPQTPKTKKHCSMRQQVPTTVVKSNDNNIQVDLKSPIEVSVYSSDDEPYMSPTSFSDSDDGGNTEDMCESGAESIETHSVLFKNIRYNQRPNESH